MSDTLITIIVLGAIGGFVYWCTTQKWLGKWKISWETYSYETYDGTPYPSPYSTPYSTSYPTPYSTPYSTFKPRTPGPNDPNEIMIDLKLFGSAEITITKNDEPVKTSYTYVVLNPDSQNVSITLTPKEKGNKVNLVYDKVTDELRMTSDYPPAKRIASFYNNL